MCTAAQSKCGKTTRCSCLVRNQGKMIFCHVLKTAETKEIAVKKINSIGLYGDIASSVISNYEKNQAAQTDHHITCI